VKSSAQTVAPLPRSPSELHLRRSDQRLVPVQHSDDDPGPDQEIAGVEVAVKRLVIWTMQQEIGHPLIEFGILDFRDKCRW